MKKTAVKSTPRTSKGGSAKNGAHASNKSRGARDGMSSSRGAGSEPNAEWLKDFLSEMLAVERGGVKLYEKALSELSHEGLRDQLAEFLEETMRHVELCEEMVDAAGGYPDEMSPGAEAAQAKAQGLLSVEVPEELTDLNNIENLVLAETKDHWDWEMLSDTVKLIKDRDLKAVITAAVREAGKQERDHLTWNSETLTELAQEMARQSASETGETMEEEEGEGEEDWEADQD
jgi:rubrerythrin